MKKIKNILDYLDEQIAIYHNTNKCYPDKFELPKVKIQELQDILSKEQLDLSWVDKRDENGLITNYKGIKLEILDV